MTSSQPDLVLLDLYLDGPDGFKVGDVLKRQAASREMLERGSYRLEYRPDMTNSMLDSIVQS